MTYDVSIIGAGPVGCKTAELISSQGFDVLIIEEDPEIGKPVQCAGLVSHHLFELCDVSKKTITNKVKTAKFKTMTGFLELKSKDPVYVINREKFDKELFNKAKKQGAKIKKNTKFQEYEVGKNKLKISTDKEEFETKLLIGADGPHSSVAKVSDLKLPNNILIGAQKTIKVECNPNAVELHFNASPDFFGWVIPENKKITRIGLASSKNTSKLLKEFINKRFGKVKVEKEIGGIIRYGLIDQSVKDRLILVGDAAGMIKPFTGGGLVYGLIGSKLASKVCIGALKSNNFTQEFLLKNYEERWKKDLGKEIKMQLKFKKFFYNFHLYGSLITNKIVGKATKRDMDFPLTGLPEGKYF